MAILRYVLEALLDALAPAGCVTCDQPCAGATFCDSCGAVAPPLGPLTFDGAPLVVFGSYQPPLSTAIVRFKYAGRPELSRRLAQLLRPRVTTLGLPAGTVLAPVPLHPRRLAARGYNQAALLAQELSRIARLPCRPRLLERTRETERQVGKGRSERLDNLTGAFALRPSATPCPSVVLVDDVITTGSTVRACAQALERGGVSLAGIVALARAEPG